MRLLEEYDDSIKAEAEAILDCTSRTCWDRADAVLHAVQHNMLGEDALLNAACDLVEIHYRENVDSSDH